MKNELWIWGHHALEAALEENPELFLEVLFDEGASKEFATLYSQFQQQGLKPKIQKQFPKELAEKRTQGMAARLKEFPYQNANDLKRALEDAAETAHFKQWAVLDGIEDPRNFGAVLRSAAAFGVSGVIVGERQQAPVTGVVVQASAGQCFRVPVYRLPSPGASRKIFENEAAIFAALDAEGKDVAEIARTVKCSHWVWVLGSEGRGLSSSWMNKSDQLARIPMDPRVESLNASAAASIAFYAMYQESRNKA